MFEIPRYQDEYTCSHMNKNQALLLIEEKIQELESRLEYLEREITIIKI